MVHLIFLDPLHKLTIAKDSTLLFCHSLKEAGHKVYLLFEEDFFFSNDEDEQELTVYDFSSELEEDLIHIRSFSTTKPQTHKLDAQTIVHMRIDPPFDARYLRYQWMLRGIKKKSKAHIINDPDGVLLFNEKMAAYELCNAVSSFVGESSLRAIDFCKKMKHKGHEALIMKPLDLFQGIGVEKVDFPSNNGDFLQVQKVFEAKVKEFGGAVVIQPFLSEISEGEIRALFFNGKHLGSILKTPVKGEFLANIAQGAKYEKVDLDEDVFKKCLDLCDDLKKYDVPWIAFDILGGQIQEVNITCPGLLVEVSDAHQKNLSFDIIKIIEESLN